MTHLILLVAIALMAWAAPAWAWPEEAPEVPAAAAPYLLVGASGAVLWLRARLSKR